MARPIIIGGVARRAALGGHRKGVIRRAAASFLAASVALTLVTVFAVRAASPGTNPFVDAVSYFNPDSAVMKSYAMSGDATDPGSGFAPAAIWYEFCWPSTSGQTAPDIHREFLVAPGGALTGSCIANTVDGGAHRESTLTGTYTFEHCVDRNLSRGR